MQPHRGTLVLVLGILALVACGPICGPLAWIFGNKDLKEMRAGRMDPSGEQMTNIGKILGMVGTILFAMVFMLYCVIIVIGIGAASMAPTQGQFKTISTSISK